ncbi:MAG: hypothetical protein GY832_44925 [Chloroflexi bacterium]|nr:hypothetical protein [Chloroflexota bacterium]
MISGELIQTILDQYTLRWNGTHGISHWARVLENGLCLAKETGALVRVVELFAIFHDSRRTNERLDTGHGLRGAEYATKLRGRLFDLPDEHFDLLYTACAHHTDGLTWGNVTVQTCWDSDRLDLSRAGIAPDPKLLCTGAAKTPDVIAWANRRSQRRLVPDFVRTEWLIRME